MTAKTLQVEQGIDALLCSGIPFQSPFSIHNNLGQINNWCAVAHTGTSFVWQSSDSPKGGPLAGAVPPSPDPFFFSLQSVSVFFYE